MIADAAHPSLDTGSATMMLDAAQISEAIAPGRRPAARGRGRAPGAAPPARDGPRAALRGLPPVVEGPLRRAHRHAAVAPRGAGPRGARALPPDRAGGRARARSSRPSRSPRASPSRTTAASRRTSWAPRAVLHAAAPAAAIAPGGRGLPAPRALEHGGLLDPAHARRCARGRTSSTPEMMGYARRSAQPSPLEESATLGRCSTTSSTGPPRTPRAASRR